jgi:hypothetical protein
MKSQIGKVFILLASVFLLPGCASVENYIHRDTEELRYGLIESKSSSRIEHALKGDADIVLVPDLYGFWPGYSAVANLYIASRKPETIRLESVSLSCPERSVQKLVSLGLDAAAMPEGNVWVSYARLVDLRADDSFKGCRTMVVVLKWRRTESSATIDSTFTFERRTHKDVAWPT